MANRNSFVLVCILTLIYLVVSSCKKPTEYPIVKTRKIGISPYFPCYPKSYWNYVDSAGTIANVTVDDDYVNYRIKTNEDTINPPLLLPRINGDLYYNGKKIIRVNGRIQYNYPTLNYDIFEPVFILDANSSYSTIILNKPIQLQTFEGNIDKLKINGVYYKTIVVNKIVFYDGSKPNPVLRYFAKDVGLVMEKVIYHQDTNPDTVVVKSITDYVIFDD